MKTRKILSVLLVPVMIIALTISCSNEDDGVTTSVKDVSSRVTGYSSDVTGAGAPLTVTGTGLNRVQRIVFGQTVVPSKTFTEVTETSLTFTVPSTASIGESAVFLVFPGSERAFAPNITVVPRPVISGIAPLSAVTGETITILGADLSYVKGVSVGGVAATIASQTNTMIKFTMPAGAPSGLVTMQSDAGNVAGTAAQAIVACSQNAGNSLCKDNMVPNGSFELGTGDEFNNWAKRNGGTMMVATTNPNEVFRGARALKVNRDGTLASGQWRLQLGSDPVITPVGSSFTASAWVRASVAGGAMRFSSQSTAWGTTSSIYQGDVVVPITWTLITWTFTANEPGGETRVILDMNGNNTIAATFYIDDLRITKN